MAGGDGEVDDHVVLPPAIQVVSSCVSDMTEEEI